jgi:hypothetical protein
MAGFSNPPSLPNHMKVLMKGVLKRGSFGYESWGRMGPQSFKVPTDKTVRFEQLINY